MRPKRSPQHLILPSCWTNTLPRRRPPSFINVIPYHPVVPRPNIPHQARLPPIPWQPMRRRTHRNIIRKVKRLQPTLRHHRPRIHLFPRPAKTLSNDLLRLRRHVRPYVRVHFPRGLHRLWGFGRAGLRFSGAGGIDGDEASAGTEGGRHEISAGETAGGELQVEFLVVMGVAGVDCEGAGGDHGDGAGAVGGERWVAFFIGAAPLEVFRADVSKSCSDRRAA